MKLKKSRDKPENQECGLSVVDCAKVIPCGGEHCALVSLGKDYERLPASCTGVTPGRGILAPSLVTAEVPRSIRTPAARVWIQRDGTLTAQVKPSITHTAKKQQLTSRALSSRTQEAAPGSGVLHVYGHHTL